MVRRLGTVCRQARENAGLRALDIAQAAGVSEATVSRFERGQGWPLQTDRIVSAYSRETGVPARELWTRALSAPDQE